MTQTYRDHTIEAKADPDFGDEWLVTILLDGKQVYHFALPMGVERERIWSKAQEIIDEHLEQAPIPRS